MVILKIGFRRLISDDDWQKLTFQDYIDVTENVYYDLIYFKNIQEMIMENDLWNSL